MTATLNETGHTTFPATAVALTEGLRVMLDSSGNVSAAGATDSWIGTVQEIVAASGSAHVKLRTGSGSLWFVAAGAFAVGAKLYGAAGGKVDDTVGTKFTGYQALQAATADGDIVAGVPCDLTDGGAGTASEVVTTTNVIAPAEDGSTFFLNSATGFVSTLPPPVLGARFTFVVSTAPTSGNHTVVTDSSANIIFGVIVTAQDAGGSTTNTASGDTVSFVVNKSLRGDRVTFVSDGTSWFASGVSKVFDGVTITQAT